MERAINCFLIAFILFTLPHAKETEVKKTTKVLQETSKELQEEEEDEEEENEEELEEEEEIEEKKPLKSKNRKRNIKEPKIREEVTPKSFTLDDLIELAKKRKNVSQPARPIVKKMQYVEEQSPIPPPPTSVYQPKKGVHRRHFIPVDSLPKEQYTFAIQLICSQAFIKALSSLISGQKDLISIELIKQEPIAHEKIFTVCQHLNLGNSITFLYMPENSQNKIFGLHLSHLIKNMAANKKSYCKRGLSEHVSPFKWTHTLATLPANKKVVQQCTRNRSHCAHLSSKIEKNICQVMNQQSQNPLEALRDLFDHGNGICSVKQIKLMIDHQEKNLIR